MCYNAVDRHVESGRGEQPAIIYDSPVTGIKQIITFRELQDQVNSISKSRSHRILTAQRAAWSQFVKTRSGITTICGLKKVALEECK